MINNRTRKLIAKAFIADVFNRVPELWKNYDSLDEQGYPKSWCPIPCPWVHNTTSDPIIGVAETEEEAREIVMAELPEDRWSMAEYEQYKHTDGKKYWIVYD